MCGFNPDFRLLHSFIKASYHVLQNIDKDLQVHLPDKVGTAHCYTTKGCSCKVAKFNDMQLLLLTPVLGWSISAATESVSIAARLDTSCRKVLWCLFQRLLGIQSSSMLLVSYNLNILSSAGHFCNIHSVVSSLSHHPYLHRSCCNSIAHFGHASVPVMHAC